MDETSRELPEEPAVYGAERDLASGRTRSKLRLRVEEPRDLRTGEVGVQHETGPGAHHGLESFGLEALADRRRAPALPDDGAVDGQAGPAVPEERRLALVGDPDRGHLSRGDPGGG